jgi:hypothetical protein
MPCFPTKGRSIEGLSVFWLSEGTEAPATAVFSCDAWPRPRGDIESMGAPMSSAFCLANANKASKKRKVEQPYGPLTFGFGDLLKALLALARRCVGGRAAKEAFLERAGVAGCEF